MSHIIQELALVLDTCGPSLLSLTTELTISDCSLVLGPWWELLRSHKLNSLPLQSLLLKDRNSPFSSTLLLSHNKVTFKNTPIVSDHLPVTLWLTVSEIPYVTPTVFIDLYSSAMLESILEEAFKDIALVVPEDAVAPGLVIRPHARVMELRALLGPGAVTVTHALVPFACVGLFPVSV